MSQFGDRRPLPKNAGSKIIEAFYFDDAASSNVQSITEGTTPSTTRSRTLTSITATLRQYGELAKFTDILTATQLFDAMKDTVDVFGEEAGLKLDDIVRDELVTGALHTTKFGRSYAQGAATWAAMVTAHSTPANTVPKVADTINIVTFLKNSKAPKFNGYYVAVTCPQHAQDFMKDTTTGAWIDAYKYTDNMPLLTGEIGRVAGVRYVEANNPFIEEDSNAEGTYVSTGDIFTTIFLGKGAFMIPELTEQSAFSPTMIIVDKADSNNPLNLYKSLAWKSFYTARVKRSTFGVSYKAYSTYTSPVTA